VRCTLARQEDVHYRRKLISNKRIFKPLRIILSFLIDTLSRHVSQNARMPTNEEKAAFTRRLELALRRSAEPVHGATELALRFNLRHQGNAVSAQTAHKWLSGRAIPTNDKLATLAEWLNVNQHWLHYGAPPGTVWKASEEQTPYGASTAEIPAAKHAGKPSSEALALAVKIQSLPPHQRYLLEELVEQLRNEAG
jgi:transcriptional regulator with XRE-family HTH domain